MEDIIDWNEIALRGVGWGHVRYLIEGDPADIIHLVWQKGNELRRCRLVKNPKIERQPTLNREGEPLFYIPIPDNTGYTEYKHYYSKYFNNMHIKWGEKIYHVDGNDLDVKAICGEEPEYNFVTKTNSSRLEWQRKCIQTIEDYGQQCKRDFAVLTEKVEALRQRYALIASPLFDLPQLFIAV